MPKGKGSSAKEKGRGLQVVVVLGVVVIIIMGILAVTMAPASEQDQGTISTSVEDMMLRSQDMPSNWTVAVPYYSGYQGTLPGNFSEAGGIAMNLTGGGVEEMCLAIALVRCANLSDAHQMWTGVKAAFNVTLQGQWRSVELADAGLLTNLTSTSHGTDQGKFLWFMKKNVLCGMAFTFEHGYLRTDAQLLELASLQLQKIK